MRNQARGRPSGLASGVGRSPAGPACVRADVVLRDLDRDIEVEIDDVHGHGGSVGYWVDGGTWTVGGLSGLCELSTNAKLEFKVTVPYAARFSTFSSSSFVPHKSDSSGSPYHSAGPRSPHPPPHTPRLVEITMRVCMKCMQCIPINIIDDNRRSQALAVGAPGCNYLSPYIARRTHTPGGPGSVSEFEVVRDRIYRTAHPTPLTPRARLAGVTNSVLSMPSPGPHPAQHHMKSVYIHPESRLNPWPRTTPSRIRAPPVSSRASHFASLLRGAEHMRVRTFI